MSINAHLQSVWRAGCRCGSSAGAACWYANWHDPKSQRPRACLLGEQRPTSLARRSRSAHFWVVLHKRSNRLDPYRDGPPHNTLRLAMFPVAWVCAGLTAAVGLSPPRLAGAAEQTARTSIHLAQTRALSVGSRRASSANPVAFFHGIRGVRAVDMVFGTLPIDPHIT